MMSPVFLCETHEVKKYFKRIHGSPKPKSEWVKTILKEEQLESTHCVLVGDSINDLEAALVNGVNFMAYNANESLTSKTTLKIELS